MLRTSLAVLLSLVSSGSSAWAQVARVGAVPLPASGFAAAVSAAPVLAPAAALAAPTATLAAPIAPLAAPLPPADRAERLAHAQAAALSGETREPGAVPANAAVSASAAVSARLEKALPRPAAALRTTTPAPKIAAPGRVKEPSTLAAALVFAALVAAIAGSTWFAAERITDGLMDIERQLHAPFDPTDPDVR